MGTEAPKHGASKHRGCEAPSTVGASTEGTGQGCLAWTGCSHTTGAEMLLVAPESPSEQARKVFQTFDPEDNGFIPDTLLEDVMKALDLVSEPEYSGQGDRMAKPLYLNTAESRPCNQRAAPCQPIDEHSTADCNDGTRHGSALSQDGRPTRNFRSDQSSAS
ncbi:UNVERIFIED_CONTAM: hypothetical protein FKN15_046721 [Acipenser sinensis]